jgi:NhaP-type Na+/H+ and K+/H+ antiporter
LRFLHSNEHAYPVTLSALLILYVVIDSAKGSAALGILTVAILLGNAPLLSRFVGLKDAVSLDTGVRGFHRQMAFIVKSFFFVFIGAMLAPPWGLIATGVLFGGILFVARIPAVHLATLGSGLSSAQKTLATVALPRGMAAGVLATLPVAAGVPGTEQLPVLVFAAVFTTILIFAVGFPLVKRGMPSEDRAADGHEVSLPAGAAVPSVMTGPSPDVLREAAVPKAPRTGFEDGVITGGSLEPDPRAASDLSDELEAPSGTGTGGAQPGA